MKQYQVQIAPNARKDMLQIWDYIVSELQNPIAAEKLLQSIEQAIYSLQIMPDRYSPIALEPWKSKGIRRIRAKNYYIYYQIQEETAMVSIVLVSYARRNEAAILKQI